MAARCRARVRRRERPYRKPFHPPPSTSSIIAPSHRRPVVRPLRALYRGWDKGEILCGWLQGARNPFFCFKQTLIALSFSQKFLAFRSRLIFFRRINFSGDCLFQFIDGPMRHWFPAHAGFLAVADQNPLFTGCPTFTRQLTKLMPKRKNLSIVSAGQLPPFHCD